MAQRLTAIADITGALSLDAFDGALKSTDFPGIRPRIMIRVVDPEINS